MTADLSLAEGDGIFRPLYRNGQWDSMSQLKNYLKTLLNVALDSNGFLEPFTTNQKGVAVRYDESSDTFLDGSGVFWQELISDVAVWVPLDATHTGAPQCWLNEENE